MAEIAIRNWKNKQVGTLELDGAVFDYPLKEHLIYEAVCAYQAAGRDPDTEPEITYVTGSLNVRYLRPTPAGVELVLRSQVTEMHEKKAIVVTSVYADGMECVSGEVVAVRVPSRMMQR